MLAKMRIRLFHLFSVMTILAVVLVAMDHYTRRSLTVKFESVGSWNSSGREQYRNMKLGLRGVMDLAGPRPEGADYVISFRSQDTPQSFNGIAYGVFGYNKLLKMNIAETFPSSVNGCAIAIDYRAYPLPWVKETGPLEEMRKNFHSLRLLPTQEEMEEIVDRFGS